MAISGLPGVRLDPAEVETNIIIFGLSHPRVTIGDFLVGLKKRRVLALAPFGGIRMVTHKDIDDEDVDRAIAACREILA
jgi:threonine aldolase